MIDLTRLTKATNYKGSQSFKTGAELMAYFQGSFPAFLSYACSVFGHQISRLQLARAEALQAGHTTLMLSSFRGSSKSFDIDCYIIWRWLRVPNTKVLILSSIEDNAAKHVRRIATIIRVLPITKWMQFSKISATELILAHASIEADPSLKAAGIFAAIEGSRADLIVPDDCEVERNSQTPAMRVKLLERFSEVQNILHPLDPYRHGKKCLTPEQTQAVYIGTPQSEYSVYNEPDPSEQHPLNGAYRVVVPALHEGLSTFPERFSTQQMLLKKKNTSSPKWFLQMMLNPSLLDKEKSVIDPSKIVTCKNAATTNRILTIDPVGDEGNGKDEGGICIAGLLATQKGWQAKNHIVIQHVSGHRLRADDFVAKVISLAREYKVDKIIVESNFNIWYSYIKRELDVAGSFCGLEKIHSGSKKHERLIETLEAPINSGIVLFDESILKDKATLDQFKQFSFNPKTLANDDRLDVISFAISAFAEIMSYSDCMNVEGESRHQIMSDEPDAHEHYRIMED